MRLQPAIRPLLRSHILSRPSPLIRGKSSLIDESLRSEVRKTVTDPVNRKAVYSLLEKASESSWDLQDALTEVVDPFKTVEAEIQQLNAGISDLVANKHPLLGLMAQYYFEIPGKRFRPTVVLLMGQATGKPEARPSKRHIQLAEIVEMIHTASLAHDDVLDRATTRRGQTSINVQFGNKFAVLVGDFLLARASVSLARLEDHTVTGLLSNMIAELVEGEFIQMRPEQEMDLDIYLRKTYLKTASMLRNASRAAAILSGAAEEHVEAASAFGENVGMAFQIVDDVLDLTQTTGKDQHADIAAGLVTAPLLYGAQENEELMTICKRQYTQEGDKERAIVLLNQTSGLARAEQLAQDYAGRAQAALLALPASHSRSVLAELAARVLSRKH